MELEKALKILGIERDQVRGEFLKMKPLDVGIFRKEVQNAELHGNAPADRAV